VRRRNEGGIEDGGRRNEVGRGEQGGMRAREGPGRGEGSRDQGGTREEGVTVDSLGLGKDTAFGFISEHLGGLGRDEGGTREGRGRDEGGTRERRGRKE
jgi:hypothetical protein